MKLSVSLPDADVALIDKVVSETDAPGRSAVVHRAVELLREQRLAQEYEQAAEEWETSGEAAVWSTADTDGLDRETW